MLQALRKDKKIYFPLLFRHIGWIQKALCRRLLWIFEIKFQVSQNSSEYPKKKYVYLEVILVSVAFYFGTIASGDKSEI